METKSMQFTKIEAKGDAFCPRSGSSACLITGKLYSFGGYEEKGKRYFNDLHVMDLATSTWSKVNVAGVLPGPRSGHGSFVLGDKMYIIGGSSFFLDKSYYNDIWTYTPSTNTWDLVKIAGESHVGRSYFSTTCDGKRYAYMYGGSSLATREFFNDLYRIDIQENKIEKMKPTGKVPVPRDGATATILNNKLYIIGGYMTSGNIEVYCETVYVLDLATNVFTKETYDGPFLGKAWHSAMPVGDRKIIVFGGAGAGYICNDTYLFDTSCNEILNVTKRVLGDAPLPRYMQASCYDTTNNIGYIVAGAGVPYSKYPYYNDVHSIVLQEPLEPPLE
eukprot:CAMPEP_0168513484 /NCGR_PEP_ID=MMETSP0405-20121227/3490_1 /TAXON_ID=498012 /ORGANISM="Trichosphaerium sp, Strain Am-I-7 wt" /LENGTH=332 /DNA_ID=CAMNT_0008532325 /DNA_START=24 /DNA_END=1025 /DNA_ORIENTATION=+